MQNVELGTGIQWWAKRDRNYHTNICKTSAVNEGEIYGAKKVYGGELTSSERLGKASARKCLLAWVWKIIENNEAKNERRSFPDRNRDTKVLCWEGDHTTEKQVGFATENEAETGEKWSWRDRQEADPTGPGGKCRGFCPYQTKENHWRILSQRIPWLDLHFRKLTPAAARRAERKGARTGLERNQQLLPVVVRSYASLG